MIDGQELVLSKSAIQTFLTCEYRWLLGYVYRIPGAPSLDMAVGTAVHAAAETYWKGSGDPEDALRAALVRELALGATTDPDEAAQANRDALTLWRTYLTHIVPTFSAPPTLIEADFLIRVDGTLVSGRIDAADGDVHDTKTTSTPSKVDPARYGVDAALYNWGYRALAGKLPGRNVLDVVAKNGRYAVKEVEPDYAGAAEVVQLVAKGVQSGDFEPTGARTGACYRCPYSQGVCRFAVVD